MLRLYEFAELIHGISLDGKCGVGASYKASVGQYRLHKHSCVFVRLQGLIASELVVSSLLLEVSFHDPTKKESSCKVICGIILISCAQLCYLCYHS